jgi:predicted alpha/beta-fold hydrolase
MFHATVVGSALLFFSPLLDTKIRYYHHPESWVARELIANCPILTAGRFIPTPYLAHGALQAGFGATKGCIKGDSPYGKAIDYERELITLPDGGTLSIDWQAGPHRPDANVVIVLHGLTGGSRSQYVCNAVYKLGNAGYRVGVLHNRGIESTPLTTNTVFHTAPVEDLDFALHHIRAKFPKPKLFGLSISAGANFCLLYAGKYGANCLFDAICAVGTPFDVAMCVKNLETSANPVTKLCDKFIAGKAHDLLKRNEDAMRAAGFDIDRALAAKSCKEFDQLITIQMHRYKTVG